MSDDIALSLRIWMHSVPSKLAADLATAADEIERLRKDAERYQWLRNHGGCAFAETDDAWYDGAKLDAEIDDGIAFDSRSIVANVR